MIQTNQNNFKTEVADYKGVVIADFFADWCGPCQILSPLLEEMSKANKDKNVKFVKINVDQNQELAGQYGIMSIPTVLFFKNGQEVNRQIGVSGKDEYQRMIDEAKEMSTPKKTDKMDDEVIIFTTPTCPYCHMAKDYFREKKVAYREVDVSRDQAWAMRMVQKSGQMGVPQMWIKGQTVVGFNKPQIDMLLGI